MHDPETWPDAKIYIADQDGEIGPYVPTDTYEINRTGLGTRIIARTNQDRIEFFKAILDLYPGPFFITLVVQEPYGEFQVAGRYYSDKGKTRVQIDYFLDYFHDFICYDGFHHLWISCETTDGIIVYDQHDIFFMYQQTDQILDYLRSHDFCEGHVGADFHHAHRSRADISPGTKELLEYGPWYHSPLEINDVARPDEKSLQNYWLRFRSWNAVRKIKSKNKRKDSK